MEAFKTHTGLVVPFDRSNVDTDAILPKQYLKMLEKTGFADFLFDDERYVDPGDVDIPASERRPDPGFILNRAPFDRASILLARANFGCGSSREHAVWALKDFGVRVVIASSFGDIFFNNCFNNGLLPVILDEATIDELFELASDTDGLELTVDLEHFEIRSPKKTWRFVVESGRRENLLNGLDEIGRTLTFSESIQAYEANRRALEPWLFE
ncbi:3-isopropylmalate/(R)-2-methylmalate dehydratase small subunit [Marinobacter sp. es.048]|uniref:3-isopropylmalate dehydratase small subunit n=1 Tax=Marinobacter sp. es.048 TaxID=1761795 RepID=UPI000B58D047|nr:3-isopropylmalate dehydratase small subunit [Marinobacter sp. es.048]SNC66350.1 3-isopropylmalate/(R)-2-methylmalate dehydratase small subunit [Marinobacter sp. es.048]